MAQILAKTGTGLHCRSALQQSRRPFADASSAPCIKRTVVCAARSDGELAIPRRQLLATGGALLAAPLLWASPAAAADSFITVNNLSGFQRGDQRSQFTARVLEELRKVLNSGDVADSVKALIHDAGTYNVSTGTGGFNGSLRLELDRPENESLKGYFAKLAVAKAAIDEKSATIAGGIGPISYADLEVLGCKVATKQLWRKIKVSKAKVESGGESIDDAFGAAWETTIGRVDTDTPDAEGCFPPSGSSTAEVKDYFFKLGNKTPEASGFAAPKPLFWSRPTFVLLSAANPAGEDKLASEDKEFAQWKDKYDRSKKTTTRTDYEVDYINFVSRLENLGATFDRNAYLVPLKILARKL